MAKAGAQKKKTAAPTAAVKTKTKAMMLDDDLSSEDEGGLGINETFAKDFEDQEQKRLMMKETALGLGGSDESEDSDASTDDEDAVELTPDVDVQIMKTINAIRRKDAAVYDSTTRFFEGEEAAGGATSSTSAAAAAAKKKKKTYKDVIREQAVAADGDVTKMLGDEDDAAGPWSSLAYDEEQRELKKAFASAANDDDDADDESDDASDDDGIMFSVRSREGVLSENAAALDAELKREARAFVEGAGTTTTKSAADAFLADFVAKRRWAEPVAKNTKGGGVLTNMGADDDDETEDSEAEEAAEAFESKYNFRFEQAGAEAIVSHARDVRGSLRRVDDARKKARAERKARKAEERQRKEAELRRLKNLRRKQLEAQRRQVLDESGGASIDVEGFLDADWDPDAHDAAMAQAFGDDYYATTDAKKKDFVEAWGEGDDEGDDDEGDDEGAVDEGFVAMDEDETTAEVAGNKKKKPSLDKRLIEEELEKLDHEDIVAGIPTRFKYREVPANSYGLTTEELLEASDLDLRQLVSIKKLAPYRDETHVPSARRTKWRHALAEKRKLQQEEAAALAKKKKKTTKKLQQADEEEEADNDDANDADANDNDATSPPDEATKKRKRKRPKKGASSTSKEAAEPAPAEVQKIKKKKAKNEATAVAKSTGLSKARLSSYGL